MEIFEKKGNNKKAINANLNLTIEGRGRGREETSRGNTCCLSLLLMMMFDQFTLIKWGREKDHDRTWRNNEVWSEVITTIKEEKESKKVAKEEVYWERRWNGRWFRMWDSRIYLISKTIQIQNEKEKRKMQTNSNCKILGGCILSNQLASHIFWIWGLSTKSKIDLIKMAEFWLTRLTNKQENTPVSILENRTYQIKS